MQGSQTHIVSRYGIELDFEAADDARLVSDRLLASCRTAVADIIDACCSDLVQGDEYLTIPYLELDLGSLDLRDISSDFLHKFKQGLARQLQQAKTEQAVTTASQRAAELVAQYGASGQYPWWSGAPSPKLLHDAVAMLLQDRDPSSLRQFKQILKSGQTLRRLVLALPDAQLVALWQALGRGQAPQLGQATLDMTTQAVMQHHASLSRQAWLGFVFAVIQRRLQPEASAPDAAQLRLWLLSESSVSLPPAVALRLTRVDAFVHILAWLRQMLDAPAELVDGLIAHFGRTEQAGKRNKAAQQFTNWLERTWKLNSSESRLFVEGLATAYRLGEHSASKIEAVRADAGSSSQSETSEKDLQSIVPETSAITAPAILLQRILQARPDAKLTAAVLEEWIANQFSSLSLHERGGIFQQLHQHVSQLGMLASEAVEAPSLAPLLARLQVEFQGQSKSQSEIAQWLSAQGLRLPASAVAALHDAFIAAAHTPHAQGGKLHAQRERVREIDAFLQEFAETHPGIAPTARSVERWLMQQARDLQANERRALAQSMVARAQEIATDAAMPSAEVQPSAQPKPFSAAAIEALVAQFLEAHAGAEPSLERIERWLGHREPDLAVDARQDLAEAMWAKVHGMQAARNAAFVQSGSDAESLSPMEIAELLAAFRAAEGGAHPTLAHVVRWLAHREPDLSAQEREVLAARIVAYAGAMAQEMHAPHQPEIDQASGLHLDADTGLNVAALLADFWEKEGRASLMEPSVGAWLAMAHPALPAAKRNALAAAIVALGATHSAQQTDFSTWTPEDLLAHFREMHPAGNTERAALVDWLGRSLGIAPAQRGRLADAMLVLSAKAAESAAQLPPSLERLAAPRHRASARPSDETPIWVANAGLVVFWPFLERLFQQLGLVEGKGFVSRLAQEQALRVLQNMVAPGIEWNEAALALPKLLCGLPPDAIVDPLVELPADLLGVSDLLIEVTLAHWTLAGKMSADGYRQAWLQRQGTLRIRDDHWLLRVENLAHDVLLEGLPWEIAYIQLPWMPHVMYVDWGEKATFHA